MEITLGQQYNVGAKPTVILYTYINRQAGKPEKRKKHNKDNVVHQGNLFKCHEEVLYLQPSIPPKRFDIFYPLTEGYSEGLGAF